MDQQARLHAQQLLDESMKNLKANLPKPEETTTINPKPEEEVELTEIQKKTEDGQKELDSLNKIRIEKEADPRKTSELHLDRPVLCRGYNFLSYKTN